METLGQQGGGKCRKEKIKKREEGGEKKELRKEDNVEETWFS